MKQCCWNTRRAREWPEDKCGLVGPCYDYAIMTYLAMSFNLVTQLRLILHSAIPLTSPFLLSLPIGSPLTHSAVTSFSEQPLVGSFHHALWPHLLPLDHQAKTACIRIIRLLIFNIIRSRSKDTTGLWVLVFFVLFFCFLSVCSKSSSIFILFVFPLWNRSIMKKIQRLWFVLISHTRDSLATSRAGMQWGIPNAIRKPQWVQEGVCLQATIMQRKPGVFRIL